MHWSFHNSPASFVLDTSRRRMDVACNDQLTYSEQQVPHIEPVQVMPLFPATSAISTRLFRGTLGTGSIAGLAAASAIRGTRPALVEKH